MVTTKVLYFSLSASVAIALAAIIFIIVDKTSKFSTIAVTEHDY
jgi:hypothetical protein